MENLRKTTVVKKGFQYRFMLIILLIIFIVTNVTGGTVYYFAGTETGQNLIKSVFNFFGFPPDSEILIPAIIFSQLIAIVVVGFVCNKISNRIAGPVYRIEKSIKDIKNCKGLHPVQLRKNDEFQELADCLNNLVENLDIWIKDGNHIIDSQKSMDSNDPLILKLKEHFNYFNISKEESDEGEKT